MSSEVPTTPITANNESSSSLAVVPTSTTSAAAATPLQQQQQVPFTHRANGSSTPKAYPPATATYDDLVQSSDLFWEKLKKFHSDFGTKFMIPTVGGKALDLHRLFVQVTMRGGIEKVIQNRQWKEVIVVFNFPTTITSASFVLRKYYLNLLYHFEQVYFFRKEVIRIPVKDPESSNPGNGSGMEQGTIRLQGQRAPVVMQLGCSVTGTIDKRFEAGYVVSVNLGSEVLNGVLYHQPHSVSQNFSQMPVQANRKRGRLALRDPSRPKSNRSGYNFFFAEHYTRLKPLYYGQERTISKKIGYLWNNLTESEKEVYQEKGLKDKERYKAELKKYKSQQQQQL